MSDDLIPDKPLHVLDLVPKPDQASKPKELIQINGHQSLTLNARRSITILWHNAHKQGVEDGKSYTIELNDLLPARHKGYEMIEEAIEQLMTTIIRVRLPDGSTTRVQFLGGNNMARPDRPAGMLTYRFDQDLVAVLKESLIWGKIDLPVLMSLSSKYAISLYENIAQMAGLEYKTFQAYTLAEFRELLGVEKQKYEAFGDLKHHVLKPAVAEINALASFNIGIMPVKSGGKTAHIHLNWWPKSLEERKSAWAELQQPKIGRKARISHQVETVYAPSPSAAAIARKAPKQP
jgi:hypothetical protein